MLKFFFIVRADFLVNGLFRCLKEPADRNNTLKNDDLDAKTRSSNQGDLLHDSHTGYGGEALRGEREKAGIDIQTLSSELRIPKSYLYALEAEAYDELPGTTYGFGYIRSYCKFLGIDDTPFLDTFKMRTAMANNGPKYNFPDEALEPRMSGAMVAMLVVLTLLTGYIGWQVYDRFQGPNLSQDTTLVATLSVENEAPDTAEVSLVDENGEQAPVTEGAGTVETTQAVEIDAQEVATAEVAPKPELVVPDDVTQDVQQIAQIAPQDTTAADAKVENVKPAPVNNEDAKAEDSGVDDSGANKQSASSAQANIRLPSEEIVISASAAAWVEVVSENGDVILSKLFKVGEDYIAPADKKLYLSTGNAGGLTLLIPGLDAFQAGAVGEIIRDLPLSRESIRSRRSTVTQ